MASILTLEWMSAFAYNIKLGEESPGICEFTSAVDFSLFFSP